MTATRAIIAVMVAPLGRVDRYELLDLVGQGSFGGVYRARHIHTGQIVALKLARVAVDPDAAARILAEGRAAASLRHPNVVGIQDSGISEKGEAFVVMELLEGRTLAALLASEGPLAPARAAAIALQMLDGLVAAHAAGVVHRDVKPSNVFIGAADAVKVIDFGISKLREARSGPGSGTGHVVLTIPGVAMGTPGYMAPEQLGDASSVDVRADVYSVGATLYEMLSKKRPIDADGFEEWMRRLATDTALPLSAIAPNVPPAIASVVDRAVARDRDARWPSAQAMRDALANALGPETVRVERVDVPSRISVISAPPPRASTLPWIFAAIGVALALMSLGGLAVIVVRGTPGIASSSAPSAAPLKAAPPPVASSADDDDDDPPVKPAPKPTASSVSGKPVKLSFYPPRTVGEIKADAFFPLAERARTRIELCNPDRRAETVFVDLMVNEHKVSQAFPSANEAGDRRVAKCVAQALLDASWPGFNPGGSGIYQSAEIIWK